MKDMMQQANPKLFGDVAIEKGFLKLDQVKDALIKQKALADSGEAHNLIGVILLEMGALSTTQLIEILCAMNVPHDAKEPTRRFPR